jgi:hypothetical protein
MAADVALLGLRLEMRVTADEIRRATNIFYATSAVEECRVLVLVLRTCSFVVISAEIGAGSRGVIIRSDQSPRRDVRVLCVRSGSLQKPSKFPGLCNHARERKCDGSWQAAYSFFGPLVSSP